VLTGTPVEATTALGSTPAALGGGPTFGSGGNGGGGNGAPARPGAGAGFAALRDTWVFAATTGFALVAGVAMVVL